MFTWGRGNYGQLGRAESTNHSPALQSDDSPAVEDVKEASFPREVPSLSGASQVYVTTTPSNLNGILDPHYHYNMCPGQRTSAEDTTGILLAYILWSFIIAVHASIHQGAADTDCCYTV